MPSAKPTSSSSVDVDFTATFDNVALVVSPSEESTKTFPALTDCIDTVDKLVVAPSAEVLNLNGITQTVEDSHIGSTTRETYIPSLVDFIIFMFDSDTYSFVLITLEELYGAHALDISAIMSRKNKHRLRKRVIALCGVLLKKMTRTLQDSLIRLDGEIH